MTTLAASDGVPLHVEAHGSGVPVVFSCGYATTCENFRPQVETLVEAGARVVLWDYRGHGRSGAPADPDAYSFERVLDDLARVIEWGAAGAPAVLVGFSFGGLASLHFAQRWPQRVRGLVLLASGPGFKNPEAQARWLAQTERTAERLETRGLDALLATRAVATVVGRDPEGPAMEAAARAIAAQDARAVALFGRRVSGPAPGVIDALPGIDVPALVAVGEHDAAYAQAAEVMAAKLPRAKCVRVPEAGHVLSLEQPEAVNRLLVAFLAELAAPSSGPEARR